MKLAYIYDAVYPWIKGGAEKRIYEISKRLAEQGHEVHWYGLKWWDGSMHLRVVCKPKKLVEKCLIKRNFNT